MNKTVFSYKHRVSFLQQLKSGTFDVIVIGGGITGAGIALDAAARGLKTALIEKKDFASGTSGRSTKLIHGGLRYLKQLQIHVVAETGRERAIVHKLAPHLVVPEKMMLPVYKGLSTPKWMISLGLWIYDLLAGVKGDDRRKMLNKQKTLAIEPLLPAQNLKGSGYYAEYMTDDARLTVEVIKTAVKQGAICLNYVESMAFLYDDNGKINGLRCRDQVHGDVFDMAGKFVVNATGIWVDDLRKADHSLSEKHLLITKGVHLVFDRKKLPLHNPLYFEIPDGRMIFMIPRYGVSYIGTTDTPYTADKENIPVEKEDVEYLLHAFRDLFPDFKLDKEDIVAAWAGLRPLIYQEGKSASEISRKDEIFVSPGGLISMAGGKLTGYRRMAEKAVDMIVNKAGKEFRHIKKISVSRNIPLTESSAGSLVEVKTFAENLYLQFQQEDYKKEDVFQMVFKYGMSARDILESAVQEKTGDTEKNLMLAELNFCLEKEMVFKPLDFLERRSSRLLFETGTVKAYYPAVLEKFRRVFQWDEKQYLAEKKEVERRLAEVELKDIKREA
ncbi:MAG: glycerol-3-phosphate dehydrogenase/oxidase [Bacteroidales bacterium]|nr:glycerol-3-phosphate dehydrogenase/oxidase [Bacteroidales bacterium]